MKVKDLFIWQFWLGLLLGYLVLGRLIATVRSKASQLSAA